jgi:hypothetical protein
MVTSIVALKETAAGYFMPMPILNSILGLGKVPHLAGANRWYDWMGSGFLALYLLVAIRGSVQRRRWGEAATAVVVGIAVSAGVFYLGRDGSLNGLWGGYQCLKFATFVAPLAATSFFIAVARAPAFEWLGIGAIGLQLWISLGVVSYMKIANRRIPQYYSQLSALNNDERIRSVNVMSRASWDIMSQASMLLKKELRFANQSYYQATALDGEWTLLDARDSGYPVIAGSIAQAWVLERNDIQADYVGRCRVLDRRHADCGIESGGAGVKVFNPRPAACYSTLRVKLPQKKLHLAATGALTATRDPAANSEELGFILMPGDSTVTITKESGQATEGGGSEVGIDTNPFAHCASIPAYALGSTLTFLVDGTARSYEGIGWAEPEPWGTWTDGSSADLVMRVDTAGADLDLALGATPFLNPGLKQLGVTLRANGVDCASWTISSAGYAEHHAMIPGTITRSGHLLLEIAIDRPTAPSEISASNDSRKLGLGVTSLVLRRKN